VARQLFDAGVQFVDVAGAGGTSWIQVEKYRTEDPLRAKAAEAFTDWGLPTADCVRDVRRHVPEACLIASGGLETGVDAAKSIALGADLAGFGRSLLPAAATYDPEAIVRQMERIEWECRIAMFGVGIASVDALKGKEQLLVAKPPASDF
jgi:isopentenyl-diphosphate delta-isomerase